MLPMLAAISAHWPGWRRATKRRGLWKGWTATFPVAANVIAPVTDLRALFSLHRSGSSGPIGHSIWAQSISFAREGGVRTLPRRRRGHPSAKTRGVGRMLRARPKQRLKLVQPWSSH